MSTYVISDIHGCYREFMQLLHMAKFTKQDTLYILGDIVDRGPATRQVFDWVYSRYKKNVYMLMGNHEDMFCKNVKFFFSKKTAQKYMKKKKISKIDISEILVSDIKPELKEQLLYYYNYISNGSLSEYDRYGTIKQLLEEGVKEKQLIKMCSFFEKLPYYHELTIHGRDFVLVHAYIEEPFDSFSTYEMLWSRNYPQGHQGLPGKTVIFGHTPTITDYYQKKGCVYIDEQEDAVTINIDCGCCWRYPESRLAMLRLEDMKIYYSDIEAGFVVKS